ncbi:PQQ-dependent sugar dehydrogenase [Kordiimonas aquimaris]|uniref:PQQ-dependent sugar dehydrogenase n=1 Tax=Kordiimonas aquimaris TaxID=707591 RepID=UPI0021CF4D06|nr:PQQ-dependent sugar dehydrogenase [Kordiimonas aquimaris]
MKHITVTLTQMLTLMACLAGLNRGLSAQESEAVKSEAETFTIETITENLDVPWAMTFLSENTALVTEREAGSLYKLDVTSGQRDVIQGLPDILRDRPISSGIFDVRAHPNFSENGWIYMAYGVGTVEGNGLAVDRFKLANNTIQSRERLFEATPMIAGKWHFGGRLVLADGYLYISTGDGYDHSALAQDLSAHAGKILRLHEDGRVPDDNPFINQQEALPEIWAYGVRNPQGMALEPETGVVWWNEHGPQGGDEINRASKGTNYGWPIITYGEEYGGGPIGDGITHKDGMEQPTYYWVPSIAPSGMTFYNGSVFPKWQGNAFVGALALTHINRLVIEDGRVLHEERLLADKGWRVRFVEQGPDGYIYFGVDDGMIMRLVPSQ